MVYDPSSRALPWYKQVTQQGTFEGTDLVVHTHGAAIFDANRNNSLLKVIPNTDRLQSVPFKGKMGLTICPFSTTWVQNAINTTEPNRALIMRYYDDVDRPNLTLNYNYMFMPTNLIYVPPANGQVILARDNTLRTAIQKPADWAQNSYGAITETPIVLFTARVGGLRFVRMSIIWGSGGHPGLFLDLKTAFLNNGVEMMSTRLPQNKGFSFQASAGYLVSYTAELPADLTTVEVNVPGAGAVNEGSATFWLEAYTADSFAILQAGHEPGIVMDAQSISKKLQEQPDPAKRPSMGNIAML
jgi:hypothetical protein